MPSGFVSTRRSPTFAFALLSMSLRMHPPGHRETVLQLFVDDRVPADDERAGLVHLVLPAAQNLGEHAQRQLARREIRRC